MSFETPSSGARLANIQSLRGIAALLVVFSHLFIIEQKYSPDHLLTKNFELGMLGVDLFFAISGFIMVHVIWNMGRGHKSATEFLFARVSRIYPIYWLVSLAVLAVYLWRPDLVFSSYKTQPNILKSFLLYPSARDPLLAVGWTLIHEIGFYLTLTPLLLLKRTAILPYLLIWTAALTIGIAANIGTNPLTKLLFSPLSYEFLAGALAGWCFKKYSASHAPKILALGCASLIGSVVYLIISGQGMPLEPATRTLYFAIPAALIVYGLAGLSRALPACSQTLGDWSYSLYLTHILSLTVMGRLWQKFALGSAWDNIPALALMCLASIFIAGIVYKFAEKPMLNLAKALRARLFPPS